MVLGSSSSSSLSSSKSSDVPPMYGTLIQQGKVSNGLLGGGSSGGIGGSSSSGNSWIMRKLNTSNPFEFITFLGASVGGGYVVCRVTMYLYRKVILTTSDPLAVVANNNNEKNSGRKQTAISSSSSSVLKYVRHFLRWLLLDENDVRYRSNDNDNDDEVEEFFRRNGGGPVITHHGSCHCESIQFQLLAPRNIKSHDGDGKISYKHVQIKATDFRVVAGHECLSMYYVYSHTGTAKKGAHGFCSRCGVHILFAPSKTAPGLYVNTNCLKDKSNIGKVHLSKKKHSLSNSFAVDGQWNRSSFGGQGFGNSGMIDNSDQLSTISEVTQPFHFQLHSTQDPFDPRIRSHHNNPHNYYRQPLSGGSHNQQGRKYSHNTSSMSSGGSSELYSMDEHNEVTPRQLHPQRYNHVAGDGLGVEVVARDHGDGEDINDMTDIPRQLNVTTPRIGSMANHEDEIDGNLEQTSTLKDDGGGGIIANVGGWVGQFIGRGSNTDPVPTTVTSPAMPTTEAVPPSSEPESASLHSAQLAQLRSMAPDNPISNINTSMSDIGDDLTTEDLFSLSGDDRSMSSATANFWMQQQQQQQQSPSVAAARRRMRRKHKSMGGLSSSSSHSLGLPNKSVSSPEAQSQMRYFLSRYRQNGGGEGGHGGGTDHSLKSNTTAATATSSTSATITSS